MTSGRVETVVDRFASEARREGRAQAERLRRDQQRTMAENLAAGVALVQFTHEFAEAFRRARGAS